MSLTNPWPSWGVTGETPGTGFSYGGGDQVNAKHFNFLWDQAEKFADQVISETIQKDGSVAMDANLDLGGNDIVNVNGLSVSSDFDLNGNDLIGVDQILAEDSNAIEHFLSGGGWNLSVDSGAGGTISAITVSDTTGDVTVDNGDFAIDNGGATIGGDLALTNAGVADLSTGDHMVLPQFAGTPSGLSTGALWYDTSSD